MTFKTICGSAITVLESGAIEGAIDLTFLDPPFNQQKDYTLHDDNLPESEYWEMMGTVCQGIYKLTKPGGSLYFMQREKNAGFLFTILQKTGWTFQNMIIWKKKTSAVPVKGRYSKSYQVILYVTKGPRPKTFNHLRIDPPLPSSYKQKRENGLLVTDVWDDIRELTSGYFAGDEAIRLGTGERFHKQQAPIALLLRIILTSSRVGDTVLDPFAGTGTTAVVANQLGRYPVSIEIDPQNVECIQGRLEELREADLVTKYYEDYLCTQDLDLIWGSLPSSPPRTI